MLKKNIHTDGPIKIMVGDVAFQIIRIGSTELSIGIAAPRDMEISYPIGKRAAAPDCPCGAGSQEDCVCEPDCATKSQ